MSKVSSINRWQVERLINSELELIDYNSTKNYKVYDDVYGFTWCFSYGTLVAFMGLQGVPSFTYFAQGYSNTTTRHTGTFIREYADGYYRKNYTPSWLRALVKDNLGYCYNYEINNVNELCEVLSSSYNMVISYNEVDKL